MTTDFGGRVSNRAFADKLLREVRTIISGAAATSFVSGIAGLPIATAWTATDSIPFLTSAGVGYRGTATLLRNYVLTISGGTATIAENLTVGGTLTKTGTGTVTLAPTTAGTLNNIVIGGVTPLAGTFTTLGGTLSTASQPNVLHNGLSTLQGGAVGEYYHLTAAQHTALGTYVVGPASATDNAIAVFDTTTGKLIKNSSLLISGTTIPALTGVGTLASGAVPASLVTAGTFGAGAYTFPSTLAVTSTLTTANIVPSANDTRSIGVSGTGYVELWISHNSSRASGLNLVQTLTGQGSPRLFFNNTTDFAGAANVIYQTGSNTLQFSTGGTPGSSSGTGRWGYNATSISAITTNAMTLGTSSVVWSNVFATRMTAPLFGTQSAVDVVIDRNSVTQLTLGSLTALFAGSATVTTTLTQNGDNALLVQGTGTSTLSVGSGIGSGSTQISVRGAAGQLRQVSFQTASSRRFELRLDGTAESGSNAGSDFQIVSATDAAAFLRTDLLITRATGAWAIGGAVTMAGNLTSNGTTASVAQGTGAGQILNVGSGTAAFLTDIRMNAAALQYNRISMRRAGSERWVFYMDNTAESGGNVGSQLTWAAHTDTGVFIDNVWRVSREAGGTIAFSSARPVTMGPLTVTGNSTITGTLGGITTLTGATLIGTTRVTSPLIGTTTAADVVFDRDSVTQLTLGSLAATFAGTAQATSLFATTRVTAPLIGTTTATDVVFDRNSVTQLTLGSLTATFAGTVAGTAFSGTTWTGTGLIQTTLTTEQMRLRYDASNYLSVTVGSTGNTSLTLSTVASTFSILGTGETLATFTDDGAVKLYHNNTERISTNPLGVDIIGAFQTTSAIVDTTTTLNATGGNSDTRILGDVRTHTLFLDASEDNLALCAASAPAWNSMQGGTFLADRIANPTGNPTGGGYLYSEGGALKWRGSGGTTTTIAPS